MTQRVAIHVVPREQNTAPHCGPAAEAQRTNGTAPAVVAFDLFCWDDENDTMVIDGAGPGEHLDAPQTIAGGNGGGTHGPTWRYRTATSRGEESTTIWVTDDLGARSDATPLTVQVGPDVDRLPECAPNPGFADPNAAFLPIYARPGATRRFGVVCSDADHDPLTVRVGTQPARGALTKFESTELRNYDWGSERWVDAVYKPAGSSHEPDPFTVVAAANGRTSETKMAIADADEPRWFNGLGCGTAPARTTDGTPAAVRFSCSDDDGDALLATVTRAPEHGVASQPVLTPARFGDEDVAIAWTPEPGFVGIDTIGVRVADGHGVQMDMTIDLYVYAGADRRVAGAARAARDRAAERRPGGSRRTRRPGPHRARHARRGARPPARRRTRLRPPRRRAPRPRRARRQHRARRHLPADLPARHARAVRAAPRPRHAPRAHDRRPRARRQAAPLAPRRRPAAQLRRGRVRPLREDARRTRRPRHRAPA